MSRKPNWKRRGISRKDAIKKQQNVDRAYALLSRKGSLHPDLFNAIKNAN